MSKDAGNSVIAHSLTEDFDWTSVNSMEDALKALEQAGIPVKQSSEILGDGFEVVDKDDLIGVHFLIFMWRTVQGTYGDMATIRAIRKSDGLKFLFVDGSRKSGILAQLHAAEAKLGAAVELKEWFTAPIECKDGLRRSDYEYEGDDGKMLPGHTFYLA